MDQSMCNVACNEYAYLMLMGTQPQNLSLFLDVRLVAGHCKAFAHHSAGRLWAISFGCSL